MTRLRGNASRRQEEQRENFYARLFDSKEMWAAMRVEGIDDEIAVLRLKFLEHMRERPEDYELVMKSASVLVRAVVAKYRMSPQRAQDLAEKITAVARDLGGQMMPEFFGAGGGDV